ncbi:MAG: VWA domain-containing protein, partial [bacterium]|nr:VWA domain-containing protein [bacterium]
LDVLVTDRQGNVILGLGPDDFIIEEAGETIPLTGASFYSNRFRLREDTAVKVQHPLPNEVPADRHFILFFHDQLRLAAEQTIMVRQQLQASRQSQRWVNEEMLPGDWVAVVSYDVKLKVHQEFTRDRDSLVRALKDAAQGKDPGNIWATRREPVEGQPSLLGHLPEGHDLRDETTTIYDGLRLLAEATRDIMGRKSVVLFSAGFGDLEIIGRSLETSYAKPDPRYYPALVQALNDNNVAIYPVDLAPSEMETAQRHSLTQLASDSGGTYYGQFVNFITPLQQIADENNGYYLLSYQAEHPAGEAGYRQVKVEARNPEFRVRARRGYRYGT